MCVHGITLDLSGQEAQTKSCYMHFIQEAVSQCPSNSPQRNNTKSEVWTRTCTCVKELLNWHEWSQRTDMDLMRSSIRLSLILLNLDTGCHLSDKPACKSVTGAKSSQVNWEVSHYVGTNITQQRQICIQRRIKQLGTFSNLLNKTANSPWPYFQFQ